MNAKAHNNILRGAFEALPGEIKKDLDAARPFLDTAGNYPDFFDDPTKPESEKVKIDANWERYAAFPETMEGPCLHRWPHPMEMQSKWRPVTRHWLGQAVSTLRSGDVKGFIKFMGCLSHWFGDLTQSAHLMDLQLLKELIPPPEGMNDFHYHTDLEAVTGECGKLGSPRLLGENLEEAVWRISNENTNAIHESRTHIIPILQNVFSENLREAEILAEPPVTRAAQMTLDAMVTAVLLARETISAAEKKNLEACDLRFLRPEAEYCDSVYGGAIVDGNRHTPPWNGKNIPAKLRLDGGEVKTVCGLGMLPHSGMTGPREAWRKLILPAGVFDRFEAFAGMHAEIGGEGAVIFSVSLDGKEVFRSGRKNGTGRAEFLSIPLGDAGEITIKVEDANDGKSFWHNHAVWGEPKLKKKS